MKTNILLLVSFLGFIFNSLSCTSQGTSVSNNSEKSRNIASSSYYEELFTETAESCAAANYVNCSKRKNARELTTAEIEDIATSKNLNTGSGFKSAELIIDNDVAFDKKLQAIQNAKKEIRMVYFIYANDDSSALITKALIEKAQAGIKVKLLVDFITNFSNFDLFAMMAKEGRGNIDIRFYNFPSARILRDAVFTTMSCPDDPNPGSKNCYKSKESRMSDKADSNFFSQLFLAGLYGKSGTALKVSLGLGGQISKDDFKKKEGEDDINIEKLKEFFELLFQAQVKNNFLAKVKLQFAMIAYGKDLNPLVNQLTGRLPIINDSKPLFSTNASHGEEWDHLTDYVHHKLIIVDGSEFQLGGRNIEDSYHMKERVSGRGKYIFQDTDFHAVTATGAVKSIENSFDRMFNFGDMVASLDKVNKYIPYKYITNSEALNQAALGCSDKIKKGLYTKENADQCVIKDIELAKGFLSDENRIISVKKQLLLSVDNYNQKYLQVHKKNYKDNWRRQTYTEGVSDSLNESDLKNAEFYYFENTPYDVKSKSLSRRVGAKFKRDEKYNKNIHELWYKELENSCRVSQNENREVQVVFHNAYLMMPSGLMYTMAKMMNGTFGDCSKVKVTFLTNSFETTDLNIINIFARYQMVQLFKYYQGLLDYQKVIQNNPRLAGPFKSWFPKLEYYEYKASAMGSGISLHTKLAVFGNDIFVGSANLDIRSYYMDTNNGVLIRNAIDLKNQYLSYINEMLKDTSRTQNMTAEFSSYTEKKADEENNQILNTMLARWDKKNRINEAKKKALVEIMDKLGSHIAFTTFKLLTYKSGDDYVDMFNESDKYDEQTRGTIRRISNEFNNLFKVL